MSTTTEKWTIFGERLKTELERQEMSLRQFAEKAGLTLTTACRYVHSQRTPRATEILKAAKVLGVTCDYMLGLSDDPHKTRDGWSRAGFHELASAQPETHDKRTKTHSCDCISRQAAIDALWKALHEYEDKTEKQFQESEDLDIEDWILHRIFVQNMSDIDRQTILNLSSAQPELPEWAQKVEEYRKSAPSFVRNQLVWALYQTWKEYDGRLVHQRGKENR